MGPFIHAQIQKSQKSVENTVLRQKIAVSIRKNRWWLGSKGVIENGDYRIKKDEEPANLIEEGTIFGDILLGDFCDSFQNLSMKEHLFLDFDKVSKNRSIYVYSVHHKKKAPTQHQTKTITKLTKF